MNELRRRSADMRRNQAIEGDRGYPRTALTSKAPRFINPISTVLIGPHVSVVNGMMSIMTSASGEQALMRYSIGTRLTSRYFTCLIKLALVKILRTFLGDIDNWVATLEIL